LKSASVDLRPSYNFLLERVTEYAEDAEALAAPERKVLAYICTTVGTKLGALERGEEKNLIINLEGYINGVVVPRIQSLTTATQLADITKEMESYGNTTLLAILEANEAIQGAVLPAIEASTLQLDDDALALVKEIQALLDQAEEDRDKLIEKKKSLGKQLGLTKIFGLLRIIGSLGAFLGPWGAAAGAIAGGIGAIGGTLSLDPAAGERLLVNNPEVLEF